MSIMRCISQVSIAIKDTLEAGASSKSGRSARLAGVFSIGLLLGGCGYDSAIFEQFSDRNEYLITGSIQKGLSPSLTRISSEDWPLAEPALTAALGSDDGKRFEWANPATRVRGDFVATAEPFIQDDSLCRSFDAKFGTSGTTPAKFSATACRQAAGPWTIIDGDPGQL